MNLQNIITAIIILAAAIYIGAMVKNKIRSFGPKNSGCGSDCGCEAKGKKAF